MMSSQKYFNTFKKLKGLILGTGSIGTRHKKNLQILGTELEIASFRKLGLKGVINKIKNSNVDFIIEALGTNYRHSVIPYILEKNIPFYIEKPAYFDVKFDKIFSDIPKEIQNKSVVGFMMRYNPLITSLKKDLKLLQPFSASLQIGHDVTKWRKNWNIHKSYASDVRGGGVLLDLCHEIDIAHVLFSVDEILSVNSKKCQEFDVDFVTSCLLRGSKRNKVDILTNINLNYLSPQLIRKGSIYGLKGELHFDLAQGKKMLNKNNGRKEYSFDNERNNMFLELMTDFLLSLIDKKVKNPLFPSIRNTLKSNHIIATCFENLKY